MKAFMQIQITGLGLCLFLFFCSLNGIAQTPSVDLQFDAIEDSCSTNQYCVSIQIQGNNGADFLGNGSIYFGYDHTVVSFFGGSASVNGVVTGSYTPINFDDDFADPDPNCDPNIGSPYTEHSFDGLLPGAMLLTTVLLLPDIGTNIFACPNIDGVWKDVALVCFEVLDPEGDPDFHFIGVENGSPVGSDGTNFNPSSNDPTLKYDNGSLLSLNTSFNALCSFENCNALIVHDQTDALHGVYKANTIESTGEIKNAATVEYKAETIISLMPGFSVNPGTIFNATNEDCDE